MGHPWLPLRRGSWVDPSSRGRRGRQHGVAWHGRREAHGFERLADTESQVVRAETDLSGQSGSNVTTHMSPKRFLVLFYAFYG